MFAKGGLVIPKVEGSLETVYCNCGARIVRPFGTASVCGPHGHQVAVTALEQSFLFTVKPGDIPIPQAAQ